MPRSSTRPLPGELLQDLARDLRYAGRAMRRFAGVAVIGVAEPGFTGHSVGYPVDVWVPLTMQPVLLPGMPGLEESAERRRHG